MSSSIVLRLASALIALGIAYFYYSSIQPPETDSVSKWRIRADIDEPIERGTRFSTDMVEKYEIPIRPEWRGDFSWAMDGEDSLLRALEDRPFVQTVQPGAFLEERFFFGDVMSDFSQRITPDKRAFSFEAASNSSIDTFIVPGSRVDVMGLTEDRSSQLQAETLLEDVEIMAVGPIAEGDLFTRDDAGRFSSYTIQATPEKIQGFLVKRAYVEGGLVLVLRAPATVAGNSDR